MNERPVFRAAAARVLRNASLFGILRSVAAERDYYEVLGVSSDADANAIKTAFRKLALQYHPDRNPAPEAEDRFKEIAKAYAVLSDPTKRVEYDAHGFAGVSDISPEDLFRGLDLDSIFGGLGLSGFGFNEAGGGLFDRMFGSRGPVRGPDLRVDLEITLERVQAGGEESLRVAHPSQCATCSGTGAAAGSKRRSCDACGGSGQKVETQEQGNVHFRNITTCPTCGGRGDWVEKPCDECAGTGRSDVTEALRVRIPVGIEDGTILRVPAKGLPSEQPGAPPGDLHVVVRTARDARFLRQGSDLVREETLEIPDAVLGATLEVPTLDGSASVRVPPGTQPGSALRIRGKGLPRMGGEGAGDLYLRIRLHVPERLTREERRLYEKLRSRPGESDGQGT
jgi:molecular chaperone DnaJ